MPVAGRRAFSGLLVGTLAIGGAAAVVVGAALPWLDTGGVKRSAFTMARIANELGVLDTSERKFAVRALLVTPIVASLVVVLLGLGRARLSGLVGLLLGVAGLGAGTVGTRFSPTTVAGPYVCLIGGAVCILGAWGLLLSPRRGTEVVPTDVQLTVAKPLVFFAGGADNESNAGSDSVVDPLISGNEAKDDR